MAAPTIASLHLSEYSAWHEGGSPFPLQTAVAVVVVAVVVVAVVVVAGGAFSGGMSVNGKQEPVPFRLPCFGGHQQLHELVPVSGLASAQKGEREGDASCAWPLSK